MRGAGWLLREHRESSLASVLVTDMSVEKTMLPWRSPVSWEVLHVFRSSLVVKWEEKSGPPGGAASCSEPETDTCSWGPAPWLC